MTYVRDRARLSRYRETGRVFDLDPRGVEEINDELNLEFELLHEDDRSQDWCVYSSDLSPERLEALRGDYARFEATVEENLEGTPLHSERALHVRTLPNLPPLGHRAQVGVFASRVIPQWSLFYWSGDLGVARSSERELLSKSARMNLRTLTTIDGFDLFQGGSEVQRSGIGVLANYSWCDTSSTPKEGCDYRLLPPHYLGDANCVYVTTRRGDEVCSALLSIREIERGEQLLMFTGSNAQNQSIDARVRLYRRAPLAIWLSVAIPTLKIFLSSL